MPTFALVSEGITDQIIIERIVEEYLSRRCDDDVEVHPLQPLRDVSDEFSAPHGGWELVFEFCLHKAKDALATNDFLIVHLDTDQGEHENFGVKLTSDGRDRAVADIVADATSRLVELLDYELYEKNSHRIIFAIAVHSVESWIVLILYGEDRKKNCFEHLRMILHRKENFHLSKSYKDYEEVSRKIKRKAIEKSTKIEGSFSMFLGQLDKSSNAS